MNKLLILEKLKELEDLVNNSQSNEDIEEYKYNPGTAEIDENEYKYNSGEEEPKEVDYSYDGGDDLK